LDTEWPTAASNVWQGANSEVTEAGDGLGQYSFPVLIELKPTAIPIAHIASRAGPKYWLFMATTLASPPSDNGHLADRVPLKIALL
jgi:hypothetical protein